VTKNLKKKHYYYSSIGGIPMKTRNETRNIVAASFAAATVRLLGCALLVLLLPAFAIAQTQNGSTLNHQLVQSPLAICLGVSGNNEVNFPPPNNVCNAGTLGSLVQDQNGVQYILSNAHVMAPANFAIGNPIQHVGSLDTINCANALGIDNTTALPPGAVVTRAPGTVANLSACADPYPGSACPNSPLGAVVDAAIAQIVSGQVLPSILDIPTFNTVVQGPILNSVVIKSGRSTARTAGKIDMVNVGINVAGTAFINQIRIIPYVPAVIGGGGFGQAGGAGVAAFGKAGDGGSLVLQARRILKSCNEPGPVVGPVGLLFASGTAVIGGFNTNVTFANRLDDVINTFSMNNGKTLQFVPPQACPRFFPNSSGPSEEQNLQGVMDKEAKGAQATYVATEPPPDPSVVDAVSKVKDRSTAILMRLPNAVGAGVGLSNTGSRQVVIRLMVSKITDALKRAVPSKLEGIPIEVDEVTNIHLL
jgi:hypothetical protein